MRSKYKSNENVEKYVNVMYYLHLFIIMIIITELNTEIGHMQ
jgi:hypothetical protein